ncbi:MAG TPA: metalloregulator ArsR/SmtB family transcription factor [Armatimonadota bacterium]|nr:metalloregulator ArsR/SmtB family transcription factor [Armatimonadota bacterium]
MAHITFADIVTIHQALSDPLRILIMRLLMERELCVCELVRALEEPQYKVSRHLAVLKNAKLVRDWREGTWMHYELAPTLSETWLTALRALAAAWDMQTEVQAALWRLHQRADRKPGAAVACYRV